MPNEPTDSVIEKRINVRSKGEIIDYILRCRDSLDKSTAIISSPFCEEWKLRYYTKKYKKTLNRCRIAGNVLIEKIGNLPSEKAIIYIAMRHPVVFDEFIKDRYYAQAWEPVIRSMKEKDYLSVEDRYIVNALEMMKKYILYISANEK